MNSSFTERMLGYRRASMYAVLVAESERLVLPGAQYMIADEFHGAGLFGCELSCLRNVFVVARRASSASPANAADGSQTQYSSLLSTSHPRSEKKRVTLSGNLERAKRKKVSSRGKRSEERDAATTVCEGIEDTVESDSEEQVKAHIT